MVDDEVKDEADEDENEDALCVLRRCCLELLSALAAVSEACSYHRQGGGRQKKEETPGGRCRRRITLNIDLNNYKFVRLICTANPCTIPDQ